MIDIYVGMLKKYAVFEGRERRKNYWTFVLVNVIISFIISFVLGMVSGTLASLVSMVYFLATICPSIAAGVRRMHDTDHAWWFLIIPFVNLIFALMPGTTGPNQYGPDPKA